MKWKHTFRHVDTSEALKTYTEECFEKIGRHLLKDSEWQIFYSMGKVNFHVEVVVNNPDSRFKATAQAPTLYLAVDQVCEKLDRQFMKKKERLQRHKNFESSKEGKLKRVNSRLEFDRPVDDYEKKTG